MTTAGRAITGCDQCGKHDDHPKVHYGLNTWHHDCTPKSVKDEILGGMIHAVDSETLSSVFEAAENGIHGDELVAHIVQLHEGASN